MPERKRYRDRETHRETRLSETYLAHLHTNIDIQRDRDREREKEEQN